MMAVDQRPATEVTRVEVPHGHAAGSTVVLRTAPATSTEASVIAPDQAIRIAEIRRLRIFAGFLGGICAVGSVMIAPLGGDPFAHGLHIGAIVVTGLAAVAYVALVRDAAHYRAAYVTVLIAIASLTNITGFYYWGVFSGYVAVVTVSAYVVAIAGERGALVAGTLFSLGGHAALGLSFAAGWLGDRSLVSTRELSTYEQVSLVALVDLVLAGGLLFGFQTRRATRASLAEHLVAMRDLARGEAQLAEVRAEMRDAMASAGQLTGQAIGRFRIGKLLGRGAMGEVYAARSDKDDDTCAIKLLPRHLWDDREARQRFEREVRVVEALSSPYIVKIIEVSPADAKLPYLVMERLEGIELATAIKEVPIRALAEVVDLVEQVSRGLDAAHAAGIVHRDLKPQNIFGVGPAGARTWKLLDFGIAKLVDANSTLTQRQIIGTPAYMAPEQARGESVDARTDIYALGVLTYRLLTGLPAVVPARSDVMLYEVIHRMPPRPISLVDLPPAVEVVLAIALAKSADDRFASAGELALALSSAAMGRHDPALAARATEILARTPWGNWARHGRAPRTTVAL